MVALWSISLCKTTAAKTMVCSQCFTIVLCGDIHSITHNNGHGIFSFGLLLWYYRVCQIYVNHLVILLHLLWAKSTDTLLGRHNERDAVSNHQPHDCLLNHLFRRSSKKTSKLHVAGLCEGNSPVIGELPAQRASNAENVSIWWRHHYQTTSKQKQCHQFV